MRTTGNIAASNALGGAGGTVDHALIPRAIFTDPPVGVVGLTDEEANARGFGCACNAVTMTSSRARARSGTSAASSRWCSSGSRKRCSAYRWWDATRPRSSTRPPWACFGATVHEFIDMIHVYPTMAEALKMVALSFFEDVEKLSCCAE